MLQYSYADNMSDASYYAGIIGLHIISIVAQKLRLFYTRQAAFNIAARLLYAAGGNQHCRVAFRRGNTKCCLPCARQAAF